MFEVATIKPSASGDGVGLRVSASGVITTTNTSLSDLIKFAYDLHARQIVGGPAWLEEERYDVTGRPDQPGMLSAKQVKAMVRKLLAERFRLAFHRDTRELPVYAITVAKSGAKLTRNDSDPNGLYTFDAGQGRLSFSNATVAEFATVLQASILDGPAVDQTRLGSARYDLTLKWTPDAAQRDGPPAADNPDAPPDLFTAFQQQLGLKLEPVKAPVEVLVIDSVERATEN